MAHSVQLYHLLYPFPLNYKTKRMKLYISLMSIKLLLTIITMKQFLVLPSPLFFLISLILTPISLSQGGVDRFTNCNIPQLDCGNVRVGIEYPFRVASVPDYCGVPGYDLDCDGDTPVLVSESRRYVIVHGIDYENRNLTIVDKELFLGTDDCPQPLSNITLNFALYNYTPHDLNITFYHCPTLLQITPPLLAPKSIFTRLSCATEPYVYLAMDPGHAQLAACRATVTVPFLQTGLDRLQENISTTYGEVLKEGFGVTWTVDEDWCRRCVEKDGLCGYNPTPSTPACFCPGPDCFHDMDSRKPNVKKKVIVGVCAGVGSFLMACFLCFFYYRRRGKRLASSQSTLLSSNYPSDSSLKRDLEKGSSNNFFTHIFSYKELEEATNNFDSSKELGDGGFGTVYHGKLRDGRSVAVKRLYENNYKRVEQFMNEVAILSGLRHQNLVSLYGCTSRHSRELLLVYEYVPNGTVADHLHGDRAKPEAPLTWPIRLSIAIETSEALSYLHAIEPQIIHRDVKTNNILLDSNFHVKVADFGLSRLFPMDVTHVSTAPQGTPGYVDPDYHQCYQLTDKSDVYSFGVVLMELISSMPAVDISRHRHEINLATMAMNKIQNRALHDLVDPKLGCESDSGVRRMVTLVAELGFRCLQLEKDMRPSMEEVVEILRGIESEGYQKVEKLTADSPSVADDAVLLKSVVPYSPNSVMEKLSSRSTTPNASG